MNYILNTETFVSLPSILQPGDTVFYETVPDYILESFKNHGIDTKYITGINITSVYHSTPRTKFTYWITETKFNALDIFTRKIFIDDSNFTVAYSQIHDNDVIYTSIDNDYIRILTNKVVKVKSYDDTPVDCIKYIPSDIEVNPASGNGDILHYTATIYDKTKNYRRFKLNAYLRSKLSVDTVYSLTNSEYDISHKYKTIIISDPRYSRLLVAKAVIDGSKVIYDRTDNWSSLSDYDKSCEDRVISSASTIFCSSHYLYNTLPDKSKAHIVLNGCDVKPYIKQEKFQDTTVVYAGKSSAKIDFDWINDQAHKHPGWNFRLYGITKVSTELESNVQLYDFVPEDELHVILEKSHYGIIPFIEGEWTKGMLPLKLFHYANAHVPTVYHNCDECSYFPDIAFTDFRESVSDDKYDEVMKEAEWKEKFEYMEKFI